MTGQVKGIGAALLLLAATLLTPMRAEAAGAVVASGAGGADAAAVVDGQADGEAAVLLERGLYNEQTLGRIDVAMALYQSIIAKHLRERPYAARARLRLGQCYLKQGKAAEALDQFDLIATQFADVEDVAGEARAARAAALKAMGQADVRRIVDRAVSVISGCADGDPRLVEAMATLKGLDEAAVLARLADHLDSTNPTIRRSAIYIAWRGEAKDLRPIADKLMALCDHKEDTTRGMAALALGCKAVETAFDKVADVALNDKSPYARRAAIYAIGYYDRPEAAEVCRKALADDNALVRSNAEAAQKMIDERAAAGKTDLPFEPLPVEVMGWIVQRHTEAMATASAKGLRVNCHVYGVGYGFQMVHGGFLDYHNTTGEPVGGEIRLGNFGTKKPDFILMDENGRRQTYVVRPNANRIGRFTVWWTPESPVAPGARRLLGYVTPEAKALPIIDGEAVLKMNNHFGSPVLESFFVVVPESMRLLGPETYSQSTTLRGLKIYMYQDEVPVNTTHEVTVRLDAGGAGAADSPRVATTWPVGLDEAVDPSLGEIRVGFSVSMRDHSWAFIKTGKASYPDIVGDPAFDAEGKTCTLPVRLEPGKVYWVGLNDPAFQGFFSATGELARPHVLLFATRSADGSPTPIPEALKRQADAVNRVAKPATAPAAAPGKAPARLPAAPRAIKTVPEALDDSVSPAMKLVAVTFDRPMRDGSWSFTGGGETYPEMTGRPSYDAARTTCRLPVKLQPGKVYWVGVNSSSHRNFKAVDRTPASRYVILFATRGVDGKPTPIPPEMLERARRINAASDATASGSGVR